MTILKIILSMIALFVLFYPPYIASIKNEKYGSSPIQVVLIVVLFISLATILSAGFDILRFWMPDNWGGYSDGEYELYKPGFKSVFGIVASFYILWLFLKYNEYKILKIYTETIEEELEEMYLEEIGQDIHQLKQAQKQYLERDEQLSVFGMDSFELIGKSKAFDYLHSLVQRKINEIEKT